MNFHTPLMQVGMDSCSSIRTLLVPPHKVVAALLISDRAKDALQWEATFNGLTHQQKKTLNPIRGANKKEITKKTRKKEAECF